MFLSIETVKHGVFPSTFSGSAKPYPIDHLFHVDIFLCRISIKECRLEQALKQT